MSDFGEGGWVVGRKQHRCDACCGLIPKGEKHFNYRGKYGDDWQRWRMHWECHAVWYADDSGEFVEGGFEMPDRVRQIATVERLRELELRGARPIRG